MKFNKFNDHVYQGAVIKTFNVACRIFGLQLVTKAFSKKKTRETDEVSIRFIIWHVLKKEGKIPLASIGRIFGFNHSSVLHGVNKAQSYIEIVDKDFIENYYKPMYAEIDDILDDIENNKTSDKIASLVRRWLRVNLMHSLEEKTKEMETKVYNLNKLISDVENMGYRIERNPEAVFVSYKIEEDKLPEEIVILRNTYGFMVQTEIE